MEETKDKISDEFDDIIATQQLTKAYRIRKLITWIIRTTLAVVLYYYFWEYQWVRWTLVIFIPLNLLTLVLLFSFNYLARKRGEKLKEKLNHTATE